MKHPEPVNTTVIILIFLLEVIFIFFPGFLDIGLASELNDGPVRPTLPPLPTKTPKPEKPEPVEKLETSIYSNYGIVQPGDDFKIAVVVTNNREKRVKNLEICVLVPIHTEPIKITSSTGKAFFSNNNSYGRNVVGSLDPNQSVQVVITVRTQMSAEFEDYLYSSARILSGKSPDHDSQWTNTIRIKTDFK